MLLGVIMVSSTCLAAQGLGPDGATAKCINGKYSKSKSMKAACHDDFGVAVWYGLVPPEGPPPAANKPNIFVKLEAGMAQELPNTVFRADKDGKVTDRWADSVVNARYQSLLDYLDKEHQESACRRSSNHCVTCTIPSHRIYCTNVTQYLPLPAF